MKTILIPVIFFLLNMISASEYVNLWSNQEIVLPGFGKWELAAGHGRILGSGTGEVRFTIPPLENGATLDAILTQNGKSQKVRFHSPAPLAGINGGMLDLPPAQKKLLQQYGVIDAIKESPDISFCGVFTPDAAGRLFLTFPDRHDFPLDIGKNWKEISFQSAKISGSLSVLYNKKEQLIDIDGSFTYAVLRKAKQTVIVFSPEFDFKKIDNVLLIKQLIKENEK